ncbi:hypothetical protein PR048_027680 [Dryococelus australis]|uniref:Lipocalin/cytosolic fatty-acid binding domain-containing protein n=1 Tax=Dryococelus australis TaxID=614101 RepID=A0ABQ9GH67_9NEOP|nr:hypothetical protein PR048_027680 [Dryococelus australis]
MGNTVTTTIELTKSGDTYTLLTTSTFKNTTISFKIGEEFEEETADGRKVKSTIAIEGNKLIQSQKGDKNSVIAREFSADEVKAVSVAV